MYLGAASGERSNFTGLLRNGYETAGAHTRLGVLMIVNDREDIALAVGADGVHVGQGDLPAEVARQIIGPGKIIGVSASSLSGALSE